MRKVSKKKKKNHDGEKKKKKFFFQSFSFVDLLNIQPSITCKAIPINSILSRKSKISSLFYFKI